MTRDSELERRRRFTATALAAGILNGLLIEASASLFTGGYDKAGLGLLIGAAGFEAILMVMTGIAFARARKERGG